MLKSNFNIDLIVSGLVKYARIGELEFKDGNESNEFEIQLNDYLIVEHVIYPEYDVDGFGYDIALLRLNRKVENIPPVCLAEQFLPTINIVIATGWGVYYTLNNINFIY